MAVLSTDALKLSVDDLRVVETLEKRIDQNLSVNWAGPQRAFDTEVIDLKWSICAELEARYKKTGWLLRFDHPLNHSLQSFGTYDGVTRPRATNTLIYFTPSIVPFVVASPNKKVARAKKGRRR